MLGPPDPGTAPWQHPLRGQERDHEAPCRASTGWRHKGNTVSLVCPSTVASPLPWQGTGTRQRKFIPAPEQLFSPHSPPAMGQAGALPPGPQQLLAAGSAPAGQMACSKRVPRSGVCGQCGLCLHPARADRGVPSPETLSSPQVPSPAPLHPNSPGSRSLQMRSTPSHSEREETTAGYSTRAPTAEPCQGRARTEEVAGRRGRQPWAALVRCGCSGATTAQLSPGLAWEKQK